MKLNHVKKARKAIPSISVEVGDSYFHWSTTSGSRFTKHVSKTRPRPSQMASSDFRQQMLSLGEQIEDLSELNTMDDLNAARDEIVSEIQTLGEEQTEKKENMPDNLQESPTSELLEERADACQNWADELENVEVAESDDDVKSEFDGLAEDFEIHLNGTVESTIGELQGCEYEGE